MQNDTRNDKVTLSVRPLHKPGAPMPQWGRYWCLESEVEREALHVPGSLVAAIHEDGRRAIMLSLHHVGVRQLATPEPAPTIRYGQPGEPRTPPADWLAVWDECSNPIEVAAYLGHLPPLAQMRASSAVARLALLPLGGDLHRDMTGALDAVDAHLAGVQTTDALHEYAGQLRGIEGNMEHEDAPDFERHAAHAVRITVERACWGWNMLMARTCATAFCDVVEHTWRTLDHAPEYDPRRRARLARPGDLLDGQPHPEILAVLRGVLGDDVYTTLPSFPVGRSAK